MKLTENKRILLNVCATYGRTLLNVACGLFTVRWVLEALGTTDFGLYGLIGGLMVFLNFINGLFSGATARFYAYSIGRSKIKGFEKDGLEDCRNWFSSAIAIHTVIPLLLIIIGWPIGDYAIVNEWLNIPVERVSACRLVWIATCVNGLASMMVTPLWAMYIAKQNIAEMTIYQVGNTIARAVFIFFMTIYPRDWLALYAFGLCGIEILMLMAYSIHAILKFQECRLRLAGFKSLWRFRQLSSFAAWQCFSNVGQIIRGQGIAIFVNKMFGAHVNAAMSIGVQVAGSSASLSGALQGAFAPAITTACGAGQMDKMRLMSYAVCKYSAFLMLLFAVPLTLELPEVLKLWLVNPPSYSTGLCVCMIVSLVIQKCSLGHCIAVSAMGDIAKFSIVHGLALSSVLLFALLFAVCGYGVYSVGVAIIISTVLSVGCDVYIARTKVGLSIRIWLKKVIAPVCIAIVAVVFAGVPSVSLLNRSLLRVFLTTACCLLAYFPIVYVVLDNAERASLMASAKRVLRRFSL